MAPFKIPQYVFPILAAAHLAILASFADETVVVNPELNSEAVAQVGEDVLHEGAYYEREVIHLSQEVRIGENGSYTIAPGYYVRTGGSDDWASYEPAANDPEGGSIRKAPDVVTLQPGFQVSGDGETVGVVTNFYQAVYGRGKGITRSTRPALSFESLQRSLVYGGKAGNRIKLGYREIWMHIVRPSELQFEEYDLTRSKVVESHGARIEVLEATEDFLKYRVLRGFSPGK